MLMKIVVYHFDVFYYYVPNSQLRRSLQFSQSAPVQRSILEKGGLIITPDQHRVTLYGKPVVAGLVNVIM